MTDKQTEAGAGWPHPADPTGAPEGPGGAGVPAPPQDDPGDTVDLSAYPVVHPAGPAPVDAEPAVPDADRPGGPVGPEPAGAATVAGAGPAVATGGVEPAGDPEPASPTGGSGTASAAPPPRRVSSATVMIAVLLALLGFTLVVQLKTTSTDPTLAATRQEDLVRILSDLESQEERLRQDIRALEESQRQLNSGAEGRKAALEEATRRADEMGILAGTLPATGPGLEVRFTGGNRAVGAATLLDAVQELRGAGAEAMQISGGDRATVRIIASTYFLDPPRDESGIVVDGRRLTGPFTITVIGDPATMRTALNIPGGVVASVNGDGGNVIVEERETAEVSAVHALTELKHARPVS
ncbi:DUF881 domain-containing protein [Micromonospora echinofusca]|uniref:DUF881 domain-containing protein n=1 Tax=Micromonospora echinofusca TaxID=47858 RepID=A0ABS3VKN9_MICEH|nr:DUF881 domain-containing protein [Micromonospora echinofusca]MBO4205031.1 DUF881 domain-containing protein [Micromonospora echinofusca]